MGARGQLGEVRVVADLPIRCDAGLPIGETVRGSGCRCRITGREVSSALDPSSLAAYCCTSEGYLACPVWQDAREREWAHRQSLAETSANPEPEGGAENAARRGRSLERRRAVEAMIEGQRLGDTSTIRRLLARTEYAEALRRAVKAGKSPDEVEYLAARVVIAKRLHRAVVAGDVDEARSLSAMLEEA